MFFRVHWFSWWKHINDIDISNSYATAECVLFGYPVHNEMIMEINHYVLIAKYYINIQFVYKYWYIIII